jgi:hypothetical protein
MRFSSFMPSDTALPDWVRKQANLHPTPLRRTLCRPVALGIICDQAYGQERVWFAS